jgi:hypothetical protein
VHGHGIDWKLIRREAGRVVWTCRPMRFSGSAIGGSRDHRHPTLRITAHPFLGAATTLAGSDVELFSGRLCCRSIPGCQITRFFDSGQPARPPPTTTWSVATADCASGTGCQLTPYSSARCECAAARTCSALARRNVRPPSPPVDPSHQTSPSKAPTHHPHPRQDHACAGLSARGGCTTGRYSRADRCLAGRQRVAVPLLVPA